MWFFYRRNYDTNDIVWLHWYHQWAELSHDFAFLSPRGGILVKKTNEKPRVCLQLFFTFVYKMSIRNKVVSQEIWFLQWLYDRVLGFQEWLLFGIYWCWRWFRVPHFLPCGEIAWVELRRMERKKKLFRGLR